MKHDELNCNHDQENETQDAKLFVETTDWFLAGMSYEDYYNEYPHEKIHGKIK